MTRVRQARRIFAVLVALSLSVAGCSTSGAPMSARQEPRLFYAKNGSVYLADMTGSGLTGTGLTGTAPRRLTDGPGDSWPAPSPDGTRVAYVHKTDPDQPGGELWLLDIATGQKRRLVDPAALVPTFEGESHTGVEAPRWSPAGDRIAFLKSTLGGGGFLLTADAGTGAVTAPPEPLFADFGYSWSPDGSRIAWVGGRSDVSPVDVNVLIVGGRSTPLVRGTNAFAVTYDADGRAVLFTNGDANGSLFASTPFVFRAGGIYAVDPPNGPAPLLAGAGAYADIQALPKGAVGFSEWSADQQTRTIQILDRPGKVRAIADTDGGAPAPAWRGDLLAYVGTAADKPLIVRRGDQDERRIDTGVDSFSWAG